jgi:DNA-binding MarR family transcriptional regulator
MGAVSSACEHAPSYEDTIEVRDHCLCLHVQRAARALARRFDDAFRPLHLTNGQFSLLMSLNRPGLVPMAAVAKLLAMDRTTLTAALKPLEQRGLLAVAADPKDKRARLLTLTAEGRALLKEALPIWHSLHREIERTLPGGGDELRLGLRALMGT